MFRSYFRTIYSLLTLLCCLSLTACQPTTLTPTPDAPTVVLRSPAASSSPAAASQPTLLPATPTPTGNPTPIPPTASSAPLPTGVALPNLPAIQPGERLSVENAVKVKEIGRWGRGIPRQVAVAPGVLAVRTATGVMIYDGQTLIERGFLDVYNAPPPGAGASRTGNCVAQNSDPDRWLAGLHGLALSKNYCPGAPTHELTDIALSPDGNLLAMAAMNYVTVWSMSDNTLRYILEVPGADAYHPVHDLEFSTGGQQLAAINDSTVLVWDTRDGRLEQTLQIAGAFPDFSKLAFAPDGDSLATGGADGLVRLWRLADATNVFTATAPVSSLWFSSDGSLLGGMENYGTAQAWHLPEGTPLALSGGAPAALAPDGSALLVSQVDSQTGLKSLRLLRINDGQAIRTFQGAYPLADNALAFSPDGRWVAAGSEAGEVLLWNGESGDLLASLSGLSEQVSGLAFAPGGAWLAAFDEEMLHVWSLPAGETLLSERYNYGFGGAQLSAAGDRLATSPWSGPLGPLNQIDVWAIPGGQMEFSAVLAADDFYYYFALSPDGERLATSPDGYCQQACTLDIWDVTNKTLLQHLETGDSIYPYSAIFSPDHQTIAAVAGGGGVSLYQVEGWKELARLPNPSIYDRLFFSPDGRYLAGATEMGMSVPLWSIPDHKLLYDLVSTPYAGIYFPEEAAFSPDSNRLAIGFNGFIGLWDPAAGRELAAWQTHSSPATSLVYSPDGSLLASGAEDGSLALSDPQTGQVLLTMNAHTSQIRTLRFNIDGTLLISTSWDGTVRFWGIPR